MQETEGVCILPIDLNNPQLLQMEIDEPFLPNIQVTLTFSDDNQYFASKITRSIIVTDEHRTAHLDVEWKPTQVNH